MSADDQTRARERAVREYVLQAVASLTSHALSDAGVADVAGARIDGVFPDTKLVVSVRWRSGEMTDEQYPLWEPPDAEPSDDPSAYLSSRLQGRLIVEELLGHL